MQNTTCGAARAAVALFGVALACCVALTSPALAQDMVVARRGGVELGVADVDAKIRTMPPELRAGYLSDPERMTMMIDTLLLAEQMAREAERVGLDRKPDFTADLKLQRAELLSRQLMEHHLAQLAEPDFELLARERYLGSPDRYMLPARIDLRHILVSPNKRGELEAKGLAEKALERARAGEDFVALVLEYSDEPSKDTRQGFLPSADLAHLDPPFVAALSALQAPGDVTGPVRGRFGYHVIRLEAFEPAKAQAFEAVKAAIVDEIRSEHVARQRSAYLQQFTSQPTDVNTDAVAELATRYVERYGKPPTPAAADAGETEDE